MELAEEQAAKEIEKVNKIITEQGQGKPWHVIQYALASDGEGWYRCGCSTCGVEDENYKVEDHANKDFRKWENIGELLTAAGENEINVTIEVDRNGINVDVGTDMHTKIYR